MSADTEISMADRVLASTRQQLSAAMAANAELNAIISTQQDKIDELENKIDELETVTKASQ